MESGCVYGYRKIHLDLRDTGLQCGVNRASVSPSGHVPRRVSDYVCVRRCAGFYAACACIALGNMMASVCGAVCSAVNNMTGSQGNEQDISH